MIMKRVNKFSAVIFALIACMSLLSSCNDNELDIFPEGYDKIVMLKQNGIINVKLNTTMKSYSDSLLILCGGAHPDAGSTISLRVMNKDEVSETWGYEKNTVEILPATAYKLATADDMVIPEGSAYKYIRLVYNPNAIFDIINQNPDVKWVLPLVVESNNATVNKDKNKVMLCFQVFKPSVEWTWSEDINAEIVYKTLDLELGAKVANTQENTNNFTCTVTAENIDQQVKHYNDSCGTNYKPIPVQSFTISDMTFTAGEVKTTAKLTLSRKGLQADEKYLLPITIGKPSLDGMIVDKKVHYVVVTNPKVVTREIDRSNWKIKFCNCQEPWNGTFTALAMIDGNPETSWGSHWSQALAQSDDFDYGDVVYGKGFASCTMRRDIPNMCTVIDLGATYTIGGVGVYKPSTDVDLKGVEIFVAPAFNFKTVKDGGRFSNYNNVNDDNEWTLAVTFNDIPRTKGTFWQNVSSSQQLASGRFIKFHPTASWREANLAQCGELYLREVVSIDGEPIKK